jgi:regulator of protease activity HflC (stomatin/prohibitin superfamily)
MNRTRNVVIFIAVLLLFLLYSSVFIVDQRQRALVVRFGEIIRTIDKPGLYFKLPATRPSRSSMAAATRWMRSPCCVSSIRANSARRSTPR